MDGGGGSGGGFDVECCFGVRVMSSIRFSGAEMNEEVQDHGDVPGHRQEIVHGVRVEVLGHGRQNEVDVYQEVTLLLVEYHHGRFERLVCDWRFA